MVPGSEAHLTLEGEGSLLKYYVPDLERDIVKPLRDAGYSREAISALGVDSKTFN